MKKNSVILLVFILFPLLSSKAGEQFINSEDHPDAVVTMHDYIIDKPATRQEIQRLQQEEKHYVQLEAKLKKLYASKRSKRHGLNGFSDPVDKWFWVWVFGWGIGILITIISGASIASGFIGILWFSFFIIGSVALIIWLIKKFGRH